MWKCFYVLHLCLTSDDADKGQQDQINFLTRVAGVFYLTLSIFYSVKIPGLAFTDASLCPAVVWGMYFIVLMKPIGQSGPDPRRITWFSVVLKPAFTQRKC